MTGAITSSAHDFSAKNDEYDIMSLEFDQNLKLPEIKAKQHERIKEYQARTGLQLREKGYTVESVRNGEVIVVTIPAHKLFHANSTTLNPESDKILKPIFSLLNKSGWYKFLLAMHSDNTGSSQYSDTLTNNRVLSICEWAGVNGYPSSVIVPYGMGSISPLKRNNSIANRRINRRLEIYIVPNHVMIQSAKTNSLK